MLFSRHKAPASGHDHQAGTLLDRGWRYDAEVWVFDTFVMRGQISQLRHRVLDAAQLGAGQRMLDVGCGTGTLAIQAARRMGTEGHVSGIDLAPRQIARAQAKARRAGHDIDFRQATIEALPFDDGSFDVVTSTLMMHHLPVELRTRGLAEINRVLKPQARLLVADFVTANDADQGHSHRGSGRDEPGATSLAEMIAEAGFTQSTSGETSFPRKHHGWSGVTLTCATKP